MPWGEENSGCCGIKTDSTSKLKSYNVHEKLLQQNCCNICKLL